MEAAPQRHELSPGTRREAVGMHKASKSFAWIGRELNKNPDTIRKTWYRYQQRHNANSAPCSGRPKKLDECAWQHLKQYITETRDQRRKPLVEISNILNLNVHPQTLRKELVDMGLGHRIERKRPYLSPKQKEACLKFAKEHIHWTEEDWRRVGFTDEMGLQTGANQGNIWVWRYPEEEYDEDCCAATHKSGFKKIKVWGAIRYDVLSKLVLLSEKKGEGKFTSQNYVDEVMDKELFDFWMSSMEEVGDILIMEDGVGYHQGAATRRRKEYEKDGWTGWGPGTWPANSPDLNPIENL